MANKTRQDAFERVIQAKTGSLVRPTEEYLEALLMYVHKWADDLRDEVAKLRQKEATDGTRIADG